jgi:hypothetical protein
MLYFSILLHYTHLTLELLCRLCATSFTILSSYSFIGHYMFRPNWPPSGVHVVMVKESPAHCNAIFISPTLVASGCFGYVGCFFFCCCCGCLEFSCWVELPLHIDGRRAPNSDKNREVIISHIMYICRAINGPQ